MALVIVAPATTFASRRRVEPALRNATAIFRRMGWSGIVVFSTIYSIVLRLLISRPDTKPAAIVIVTIVFGFYALAFALTLTTARRLECDFIGNYRRARWSGILIGTFFFPWWTIMAAFAVRRLEEYRRKSVAVSLIQIQGFSSTPSDCNDCLAE